jgi:hypothetical protein
MRKSAKTVTLARETLKCLDAEAMRRVAGGATTTHTSACSFCFSNCTVCFPCT